MQQVNSAVGAPAARRVMIIPRSIKEKYGLANIDITDLTHSTIAFPGKGPQPFIPVINKENHDDINFGPADIGYDLHRVAASPRKKLCREAIQKFQAKAKDQIGCDSIQGVLGNIARNFEEIEQRGLEIVFRNGSRLVDQVLGKVTIHPKGFYGDIVASTKKEDFRGASVGNSYEDMIKVFKKIDEERGVNNGRHRNRPDLQMPCVAQEILDFISTGKFNQYSVQNKSFCNAFLKFIVTTQLCEEIRNPGTAALARACLRKIADGESTFELEFGKDNPIFRCAQKGGSAIFKAMVNDNDVLYKQYIDPDPIKSAQAEELMQRLQKLSPLKRGREEAAPQIRARRRLGFVPSQGGEQRVRPLVEPVR